VLVLLAAVAVAAVVALHRRRVDGRFTGRPDRGAQGLSAGGRGDQRLTEDDLGQPLGRTATVVQFSSSFCAPCRAAERMITATVAGRDDVRYVDLDAEQAMDLVRRFNVLRTPTILVTDADGRLLSRTAGVPTARALEDVLAGANSR
jgi:thiol-disulfide isomerase/thioredoxin